MMVVAIDDRQAASEMTRHLIDLGHRRIAFIQGNPQHRSSARRLEGFRATMTAQALAGEEGYIVAGEERKSVGLGNSESVGLIIFVRRSITTITISLSSILI